MIPRRVINCLWLPTGRIADRENILTEKDRATPGICLETSAARVPTVTVRVSGAARNDLEHHFSRVLDRRAGRASSIKPIVKNASGARYKLRDLYSRPKPRPARRAHGFPLELSLNLSFAGTRFRWWHRLAGDPRRLATRRASSPCSGPLAFFLSPLLGPHGGKWITKEFASNRV